MEVNLAVVKLMNIVLKKEYNLLPLEPINVGFGAKAVLKKLKTVEKPHDRQFRKSARAMLVKLHQKLFERCPLKYKMTGFLGIVTLPNSIC